MDATGLRFGVKGCGGLIFESALLGYALEFVGGDVDDLQERHPVVAKFIPEPGKIAVNHPVVSVVLQAERYDRGSIGGDGGARVPAVLLEDDDEPMATARREGGPELHADG